MITRLIRELMAAKEMSQQDLADLLGSSLSRVKAITSDRVAKLKPEEIRVLVEELHVNADWLATGNGPMFRPQVEESQDALARRMQVINDLAVVVDAFALSDKEKLQTKLLLSGDVVQDAELIARLMRPTGENIVDVSLVVRIAAAVETALTKNRARIAPAKKEELVKLLYDHFSAKGRFEEEMVERHLRLVINH